MPIGLDTPPVSSRASLPCSPPPLSDLLRGAQAAGFHFRVFEPGEVLHREEECADRVVYVESGHVVVSSLSAHRRVCVVDIVGPGGFVGEACLEDQTRHASTAEALDEARAWVVEREAAHHLLKTSSQFGTALIHAVLEARQRAHRRLIDQVSLPAELRLGRLLIELASRGAGDDLGPIRPKPTHERLAQLVGTTRPRVTTFMTRLRRQGHLGDSGDALVVNPSLLPAIGSRSTVRRATRPKRDNLVEILDAIAAQRGPNGSLGTP